MISIFTIYMIVVEIEPPGSGNILLEWAVYILLKIASVEFMGKSNMNRLMLGTLVFMMSAFSVFTASAAGNNSIKIINIQDSKDNPISNWNLSIYEVASYDASTYTYSVTDDFGQYIDVQFITEEQTANDVSNKATELQDVINTNGLTAVSTVATDAQGTATFTNLEDGLYIICYQSNTTYDSSPTFIEVPDYDNNQSVTVEAKIEDVSSGGDTPGNGKTTHSGGGNGGGNDSDNYDGDSTTPPGNVLGEGREHEVPDVNGPDDKIVLGAKRTPQTGDASRMNLYRGIATLALAILFSWIIIYYKRNHGTDNN